MKKILMVASKASHFKNFHIPYIRYLIERGCAVFTASEDDFRFEGAAHIKLPFKKKLFSLGNLGGIFSLAKLMRKERFDLLYTNSTLAGAMGRCAAILSGCKNTKAVHICHGYLFSDDGSKRTKLYLTAEKLLRKRTDLLAVMNGEDLRIAEKYSLGSKIVFINGMGLDTDKFPPLNSSEGSERESDTIKETRKSLSADENTFLFLCAGEFSARKSQKTIIKALPLLNRKDYKIVFAGEGALAEECRKLAESLGVKDKTVFIGHCDKMNALYRSCDCLISAGRFEGLPFNVMEALYCGENIIVSDVKGNNDLAAAVPENAEMFPYEDRYRLAELMDKAQKPPFRICRLPRKYFLTNVFTENLGRLDMKILYTKI